MLYTMEAAFYQNNNTKHIFSISRHTEIVCDIFIRNCFKNPFSEMNVMERLLIFE